jgi:uncharacterized protein (TIGR03437 family)
MIALAVMPAAWCQAPVVSTLVNSASYQPTIPNSVAMATIFGTNLATTTATAGSAPLPYLLAGTSVTIGGAAAPLFYVSPTQINLQVPIGTSDEVVVSTAAGSSAPYDPETATPDAWQAGGLFAANASGCGEGAVLNVAADGSTSVNSTANSASPGQWISLFGTGIAEFYYPQPIDFVAPLTQLWPSLTAVGAQFDLTGAGVDAAWTGLAPGFVGLEQANVKIPATVREGCAVPLQAVYPDGGLQEGITQPVTIAIRQGGGSCVDPPAAGYGQIVWQKIVSATAQNVVSETDTMTASLQTSPGMQAPPAPASPPVLNNYTYFGPSCPVPGYRSLAAGPITAQTPSSGTQAQAPFVPFQQPQLGDLVYQIIPLEPGQLGGLSVYQAALPPGTIQAGKFTVTGSGGADVGAFQAAVNIGADIQIQTALAGITLFSSCGTFPIIWTGGDPNSWVTVSVVHQAPGINGGSLFVPLVAQARASDGVATLEAPSNFYNCGASPSPIQIAIEVDPDPSEIAIFSAPGLSLGGRVTWSYIHTFQAYLETY